MRLGQIILFVKDIGVMTAFYRDTLGLKLIEAASQEGFHVLDVGGATLALHAIPEAHAKDIEITDPPRAREEMPTKVVFVVKDVVAERARLVGAGVVMNEMSSWGGCDGLDPEGNVFSVASITPGEMG